MTKQLYFYYIKKDWLFALRDYIEDYCMSEEEPNEEDGYVTLSIDEAEWQCRR